ncbi:hypothetical protein ACJIZ3_006497 [Penstemon smallii]|uniref:Agenet-like domain-containing protein n=1 Tax=Penstemon smallii TaxID=265156 RepID=A0ABD3S7Z6_9LAMI
MSVLQIIDTTQSMEYLVSSMYHFSKRSSLPDKKESRDLVLENSDIVWSIDENVEVLNQDSGLRGCWYWCKILDSSKEKKSLKDQYCDLMLSGENKKLKVIIPSNIVANPDKLGMRFTGRLMVRPWTCQEFPVLKFKVGDAADAWHCDGWWEGIVLGYSSPDEISNLQVCLLGSIGLWSTINDSKDKKLETGLMSYLRSLMVDHQPMLSPPTVLIEPNSSAVAKNKVCNSPRLEESENVKRDVPSSSKSAGSKAVERPNKRKGLLIKEEGICSSEKKPLNLALTKFNKSKPVINISKPAIKKSKPAIKKSK